MKVALKETELSRDWKKVEEAFNERFGGNPDLESILFIIGIQELGVGYTKLGKSQKQDTLHIAICTLLEPYGFYEFTGRDTDGWPHWTVKEELPTLVAGQQQRLMKEAIISYCIENSWIE